MSSQRDHTKDSESIVAQIMSIKSLIVPKTSEQTVSPSRISTSKNSTSNYLTNTEVTSNEQLSEQTLTAGESNVLSVTSQISTGTNKKQSGGITLFTTLWQIFKSTIDKNEELAEIHKFHHLHSLLKRSAARAIQGLALTSANFEKSIKALKQRFSRPQQIIAFYMDELLKLPVCFDDKSMSMQLV